MKIEYRGKNMEEDRDYREAWISFNETKEGEEDKMNKIVEALEKQGWKCYCEEGITYIPVSDKDDYNELVADFKEAKKGLRRI